ncbi:hemerythrin domain-containing protein [Desulfovibrio sp. X2]|uniref:hemerythrin domain-containing protein n=1 Tax=Desulfovibrio sp. X2 TaxID=941449 RepID=UPI000558E71A|nr:hemerythrin domain-containing protein [Desulfovibrio sp. X2]
MDEERRRFLRKGLVGGMAALGLAVLGPGRALAAGDEVRVSANEDLMREHGVLIRLFLVYDEVAADLLAGKSPPKGVLAEGVEVMRRFGQDYHERMEEEFVFASFPSGPMATLSGILFSQHEAGRRVTARLAELAKGGMQLATDHNETAKLLHALRRMYFPHLAREDTVLFPAFHATLSPEKYAEYGERFEELETKQLGAKGFEKTLATVAELEKSMGIADLASFTPKV